MRQLDRWVVRIANQDRWPIPYMGWALALFLFIAADLVVFLAV